MKSIKKKLSILTLCLVSSSVLAMPKALIINNQTSVESNAYIDGVIPSPAPSKPYSRNVVSWMVVQIACYGRTVNDVCPATIKMATNTSQPMELGKVSIHLKTGDINPKFISANGFTLVVNGPAEATLTQNG